MMRKLLPFLIGIIMLLVGAGGAFLVLRGGAMGASGAGQANAAPAHRVIHEDAGQLIPLPERTVNLADQETHYLKASISIRVIGAPKSEGKGREGGGESSALPAEVEAVLMDALIETLGRQEYRSLLTTEGKRKLKEELTKAFDECVQPMGWGVREVLFTDFVME